MIETLPDLLADLQAGGGGSFGSGGGSSGGGGGDGGDGLGNMAGPLGALALAADAEIASTVVPPLVTAASR
jgi:hypothetical protein